MVAAAAEEAGEPRQRGEGVTARVAEADCLTTSQEQRLFAAGVEAADANKEEEVLAAQEVEAAFQAQERQILGVVAEADRASAEVPVPAVRASSLSATR